MGWQDFSSTYLHMQGIKMETETVYYNIAIDKSASEIVKGFIEELGGQIAEEKQLKFEDLGLAEIEGQRGHYQCLVCSSTFNRKGSAVFHFKKFHIKQTDLKIRSTLEKEFPTKCRSERSKFLSEHSNE